VAARREAAELRGDKNRAELVATVARCREEAKRLRRGIDVSRTRRAACAQLLEPQYRYAMSLDVNQREADSERGASSSRERRSQGHQAVAGRCAVAAKQGRAAEALRFAERLLDLQPGDEELAICGDTLAAEAAAGPRPTPASR
jgi:hypothetical protein